LVEGGFEVLREEGLVLEEGGDKVLLDEEGHFGTAVAVENAENGDVVREGGGGDVRVFHFGAPA